MKMSTRGPSFSVLGGPVYSADSRLPEGVCRCAHENRVLVNDCGDDTVPDPRAHSPGSVLLGGVGISGGRGRGCGCGSLTTAGFPDATPLRPQLPDPASRPTSAPHPFPRLPLITSRLIFSVPAATPWALRN